MRPKVTVAVPPVQPLAVTPYPARGEHFASYARRLAVDNGFGSVAALARHLGLPSLGPNAPEQTWTRLREATGLAASRLAPLRMRHHGSGPSKIALTDGIEIQYFFVDRAQFRSCPLCLEQDGRLSMRFAIRQVTACSRHGVRLTDECSCGQPRRLSSRLSTWSCPSCGLPFSDIHPEPADPRELLIARLLCADSGHEDPDLPDSLLGESLTGKASVVERLGRLHVLERNDARSALQRRVNTKLPDVVDRSRRLSGDRAVALGAADLLTAWPRSYHALLDRLLDRCDGPEGAEGLACRLASRAGRLAQKAFVDYDRRIIAFAEQARTQFIRGLGDRDTFLRSSGFYASLPGGPVEITEETRSESDFVGATEFGRCLRVGDWPNKKAWFEAGLIDMVRHVDGTVVVRRSDFNALLRRIADLPIGTGEDNDFKPLVVINRQKGRSYRASYLIKDILTGRIRSRTRTIGLEGRRSFLVNEKDFHRRRLLCGIAVHIIQDGFVKPPSFIPQLWDARTPHRSIMRACRKNGGLRTKKGSSGYLLSMRDLINAMQQETGKMLFYVDPVKAGAARDSDWRSLVVEDRSGAIREWNSPSGFL